MAEKSSIRRWLWGLMVRGPVRELTAMPVSNGVMIKRAIVRTVALATHHLDSCWQAFLDTGPSLCYPSLMTARSPWSGRWMTRRIRLLPSSLTKRSYGANRALSSRLDCPAGGTAQSFPLWQCHAWIMLSRV